MIYKKAIADARKFSRRVADNGWGYLIRKRKERTAREETIAEAQRIYWRGIKRAWRIYTGDNEIVKQANENVQFFPATPNACITYTSRWRPNNLPRPPFPFPVSPQKLPVLVQQGLIIKQDKVMILLLNQDRDLLVELREEAAHTPQR